MTVHLDPGLLIGFLLALVRATAWVSIAPPFATPGIPAIVKVGIGGGLAVAVVGSFPHAGLASSALPSSTPAFIGAIVEQALTGLVLGFITSLLFAAVASAGAFIDLFAGLNLSSAMDPLSLEQQPIIGRIYGLVATLLLFASNGYLLLIKGFLTSFDALPLSGLKLGSLSQILVDDIGTMFLSALEIAGPLIAVLFLSDVVIGLLARAAPQLNLLQLSMSLKVLLAVLLVGLALPLLPGATSNLVDQSIRDGLGVLHL